MKSKVLSIAALILGSFGLCLGGLSGPYHSDVSVISGAILIAAGIIAIAITERQKTG